MAARRGTDGSTRSLPSPSTTLVSHRPEQGSSDRPACQGRASHCPCHISLLLPRRTELGGSSQRTHGAEIGAVFALAHSRPSRGTPTRRLTLSARVLPATAPTKPLPVLSGKALIDCSHDAISRHSVDQNHAHHELDLSGLTEDRRRSASPRS